MEDVLTITKQKSKSVIINESIHTKFKMFCKGKNYKIGGVIEDLIGIYLKNPREIQKLIDEYRENK